MKKKLILNILLSVCCLLFSITKVYAKEITICKWKSTAIQQNQAEVGMVVFSKEDSVHKLYTRGSIHYADTTLITERVNERINVLLDVKTSYRKNSPEEKGFPGEDELLGKWNLGPVTSALNFQHNEASVPADFSQNQVKNNVSNVRADFYGFLKNESGNYNFKYNAGADKTTDAYKLFYESKLDKGYCGYYNIYNRGEVSPGKAWEVLCIENPEWPDDLKCSEETFGENYIYPSAHYTKYKRVIELTEMVGGGFKRVYGEEKTITPSEVVYDLSEDLKKGTIEKFPKLKDYINGDETSWVTVSEFVDNRGGNVVLNEKTIYSIPDWIEEKCVYDESITDYRETAEKIVIEYLTGSTSITTEDFFRPYFTEKGLNGALNQESLATVLSNLPPTIVPKDKEGSLVTPDCEGYESAFCDVYNRLQKVMYNNIGDGIQSSNYRGDDGAVTICEKAIVKDQQKQQNLADEEAEKIILELLSFNIKEHMKKVMTVKLETSCDSIIGTEIQNFIEKYIFTTIRIATPFLFIVLTMVDIVSAISSNDEEKIKKVLNKFVKRLIIVIIILIIPTILKLLFDLIGFETCV